MREFGGLVRKIRSVKNNPFSYPVVLPLYTLLHPRRSFQFLIPARTGWKIIKPFQQQSLYIPSIKDALLENQRDYSAHMYGRYTLGDFIEVSKDDYVVDVGAFVGGFSKAAHSKGAQVLAIEVNPENLACLRRNVDISVEVIQCAIWDSDTTLEFNFSSNPQDHSIFDNTDKGKVSRSWVSARRLETIIKETNAPNIDFLKLEAEGAEPEALHGLGNLRPTKVAVSCGPEREGEDTSDEVQQILLDYGYEIRSKSDVVYAKR